MNQQVKYVFKKTDLDIKKGLELTFEYLLIVNGDHGDIETAIKPTQYYNITNANSKSIDYI